MEEVAQSTLAPLMVGIGWTSTEAENKSEENPKIYAGMEERIGIKTYSHDPMDSAETLQL